MTDRIESTLRRLGERMPERISRPGDRSYDAATAIWAQPVGRMPRAVAHCRTAEDVQSAIRAARDCDLPLSVRGGGHDWAGRALCDGLVIDLGGMKSVSANWENGAARIAGGARASDVVRETDPLGLAPVTGAVGAVGMAGLTLGGGYGPLIGRFDLAVDNLLAAEVVLADGRIVTAGPDSETELFWALRGGGGNFGVVTLMYYRLHALPSVRSGMLIYPFTEAGAVLGHCAEIASSAPEELTVQVGIVTAPPNGEPVVFVVPTWCGEPTEGEARVEPFLRLGTLLNGGVDRISYGASLSAFDAFVVNGRRTFMETCWLPSLDSAGVDAMIRAMATVVSPVRAIFTHEFKGAATGVPLETTAFGLRRGHVLVEILAAHAGRSDEREKQHRQWALAARHAFDAIALPGGYPNLLAGGDANRTAKSYGRNAERLVRAKRRYDPDNVFWSAIPLPVTRHDRSRLDQVNA